jgi:hypothetical protein
LRECGTGIEGEKKVIYKTWTPASLSRVTTASASEEENSKRREAVDHVLLARQEQKKFRPVS